MKNFKELTEDQQSKAINAWKGAVAFEMADEVLMPQYPEMRHRLRQICAETHNLHVRIQRISQEMSDEIYSVARERAEASLYNDDGGFYSLGKDSPEGAA